MFFKHFTNHAEKEAGILRLSEITIDDLMSPLLRVLLVAMVGTCDEFIDGKMAIEFRVALESNAPVIYS